MYPLTDPVGVNLMFIHYTFNHFLFLHKTSAVTCFTATRGNVHLKQKLAVRVLLKTVGLKRFIQKHQKP
jgi:hypothetical protein